MYKEPEYLTEYKKSRKLGPPRCCHTCDFYGKKYMFCSKYDTNPPEDFAAMQNACPDYFEEIPF